jgi:hypothetical protein
MQLAGICLVFLIVPASMFALSKKDKVLLRKNFYFLYLLEENKVNLNGQPFEQVRRRLINDARGINCHTAACYSATLQFTGTEIEAIGNELVHLSVNDEQVKKLVHMLKLSRAYQLFAAEPDTAFIRKVWLADARGIDNILDTYIGGRPPLYSKIDAISFKEGDTVFLKEIARSVQQMKASDEAAFYRVPLLLALEALRLNGRDEAARYEPLTGKGNAAAYRRVKSINWQLYPYSAILVPGLGPEQAGVRLDPNGAKRCDSAALRYRAGKAPFLIVSGGHVHPYKTPYCEAVEMKAYLVKVLHIPSNAVIIEPHARHTTTNLRNANRLIYRFNMPANKPVLIVTDASQSRYINNSMGEKVVKELGYKPYTAITKLSAVETAYVPSENSMQINSPDPLDP